MKKDELIAVGAIFVLIVMSASNFYENYKTNKKIEELHTNYKIAQKATVELNNEVIEAKKELNDALKIVDELESDMKEVQTLIKIKEDLRSYSIEEKAMALAIAWTESTWRLRPNHRDGGFTVGPCGVTEYHKDYLNDLGLNRYSFASCIEIYKFYKEENNGSREKAIKDYKGIVKNTYLINKTINLRDKILKILKEYE
jgi:hypothetical protein